LTTLCLAERALDHDHARLNDLTLEHARHGGMMLNNAWLDGMATFHHARLGRTAASTMHVRLGGTTHHHARLGETALHSARLAG
jgi:hypothetical protein